ncbi:unnamed protein product [Macrosiphum euphorbiae]|uniref:Uncharacterized protein n=1 Tax=Macrosiphum euphorbiae TaxID=13131 RepID=A0AAV0XXU4_9HEMI|nr:unnamed protein product [Macrosiphum euphorbiae]
MDDPSPKVLKLGKIKDLSLASLKINSSTIFNLKMYNRWMVNYLVTKQRELYDYSNFPLNYIRSGMSKNRNVYMRMSTCARTAPDMPWLNMYRDEINKEINLVLDPTSSILIGYYFIRDTRRLLDIQVAKGIADSLLFPNKC